MSVAVTGANWRWRGSLLALLLPLLLLGFSASALANRLVFAGWGLAAAAVATPVLRRSFEDRLFRPGGAARVAATALFVAAVALGLFAVLVERDHEVLDLGARAVLAGVYVPAVTAPATYFALAAALALTGVALALAARSVRRRASAGENNDRRQP